MRKRMSKKTEASEVEDIITEVLVGIGFYARAFAKEVIKALEKKGYIITPPQDKRV